MTTFACARWLARPASGAALCAVAAAVQAQAPAASSPEPTLAQTVVTATRVAQPLTDVLADVSVIDAEALARSGAVSLADVLQQLPGVELVRNGGPMATTSLFVRGGNANHVVVMVDGIRLDTQSGSGGATLQAIPLEQVQRIEVLRGPAAAVYGSDAVAGVVQVFTRRGAKGVQPTVSVGAGRYGSRSASVGVAGGAEGWDYALALGQQRSDGFNAQPAANPDRDGYSRDHATARLGRELGTGHRLDATLVYSDADAGYDATTTKTNALYAKDNRTRQRLGALGLAWEARWSEDWRSTLRLTRADDRYQTLPEPSAAPNYDTQTRVQTALWHHSVRWQQALWTLGLESRRDELDNSSTAPTHTRRTQHALALGVSAQRGAHHGQVNARVDDDSELGTHTTTGTLAYGLDVTPQWRLHASLGSAFRAPTLYQRFSPYGFAGLKPEESLNRELGVRWQDGVQRFSAVAYHNRVSNLIAFGAAGACASTFGCYANTAKATLQGLTLAGSARVGQSLLSASLDLQQPKDALTGKRLARRATRLLKLGADTSWAGWDWGAQLQLVGARYDNAANTMRLAGYGLLGLSASRALNRQTELLLRLDNATDQRYQTARGYATAGRSAYVGLRWTGR